MLENGLKPFVRYYKLLNDAYLENGRSLIRVGHVLSFPSPLDRQRTVKVFEVLQTVKGSRTNLIARGSLLALSFPNTHFNAEAYEWGKLEECMVPMEINDRQVNIESVNRMAARQRKLQAEANERAAEQPPPGP
jgi:hypothetical protein